MHTKANDAPRELVHDHEHPVGLEQNGLATKESRALAPDGITAAGFQRPLTEPSVHLSLCTRLSRNHGESRRQHPTPLKAFNPKRVHKELLSSRIAPDLPRWTSRAG